MKGGSLEASVVVSGAQWYVTLVDSGGPTDVVIPPGPLWPTELVEYMDSQMPSGWSIALDGGESGTGLVTIAGPGTFSIVWGTSLRSFLGFGGNASNVTVPQVGTAALMGLWIPGVPKFSRHGDGAGGALVTDYATTISPTGKVRALLGNTFRQHDGIRWDGVHASRALRHFEQVQRQSFESWFMAVLGLIESPPLIGVNPLVRLAWDAANPSDGVTGRLVWSPTLDLEQFVRGWVGRFTVNLPTLVAEDPDW